MNAFKKKALAYILSNFQTQERNNGFYSVVCPGCGKPLGRSGSYSADYARYWCFQAGCSFSKAITPNGWSIYDFIQANERGVTGFVEARQVLERQNIRNLRTPKISASPNYSAVSREAVKLPEGTKPLLEGFTELGRRLRDYLEGRGYDLLHLQQYYGIGYIDERTPTQNLKGYMVIPFKDTFGRLIYYQLRDFLNNRDKNRLRWKNPDTKQFGLGKGSFLFNEPALVLQPERLFLHEGATDCMTTDGVGSLGLSITDTQLYKLNTAEADEIVVMLDEGAWRESLLFAEALLKSTNKIVKAVPMYEGMDDPNALGRDECIRLANKAIEINEISILEEFQQIERRLINGTPRTFRSTGIKSLW